ncbi:ABC transporter permease [Halovulum sp. GXIMD14793]
MDFMTIIDILASTMRLATPLLLACLAGLFSERSGIVDIGLEGKMLAAAFLAGAVATVTGSIWLGLLAGIGGSLCISILHGLASITFKGDQLISGVALNFLAAGLAVVVGQSWFGLGGRTPSLQRDERFGDLNWPFSETLADTPVIGPIYSDLLSGHTILVYIALLLVPLSWYVLYRTRYGLRLRAVGENPSAVDTAGVSVTGLRWSAIIIAGVLCGLARTYLASIAAGFGKDMTAGRGYIALAALIFAKWRPWYALLSCLLFGLLEAIGLRYPNIRFADLTPPDWALTLIPIVLGIAIITAAIIAIRAEKKRYLALASLVVVGLIYTANLAGLIDLSSIVIPSQFMQALPYILTVIILAGFVGKAIPPRASAQPYIKER